MKIESIEIRLENLKLSKPYRIAFKTIDFVENLFVMVRMTNGIIGYGSCNPENEVAFISRKKTLESIELLDQDKLKSISFDDPWTMIHEINTMLDHVPTLQAALEISIWDAWGKSLDKSVLDIWGKKIDPLPTSVTIGIMDAEQTLQEAHAFIKNGFDHLKIKIGIDPESDTERIIKLREEFKDSIVIRADINQGYRLEDFTTFLSLSENLGIELYEQPLRRDQFTDLDTINTSQKSTIAADESLLNIADANELITNNRCGILNIKIMKCGGPSFVDPISELAKNHQVTLMWGCNDESRLSIAAAMNMAYAHENTKYLDLDGSFDLAYDPALGGFEIKNGVMIPVDKPGFGIDLEF
ncbi:MAG: dipeptide epimerase [Saprospiraceae bacterium]